MLFFIVLKPLTIPENIRDKIFEIKTNSDNSVFKIISYFPLSELERKTVAPMLNSSVFSGFYSIFTDKISEAEWNKTKKQIKKRFQSELFDIDNQS